MDQAAGRWLRVDGASVTLVSGKVAPEPLFASDELSARLEELLFTTGGGRGAEDFGFGFAGADRGPGVWAHPERAVMGLILAECESQLTHITEIALATEFSLRVGRTSPWRLPQAQPPPVSGSGFA